MRTSDMNARQLVRCEIDDRVKRTMGRKTCERGTAIAVGMKHRAFTSRLRQRLYQRRDCAFGRPKRGDADRWLYIGQFTLPRLLAKAGTDQRGILQHIAQDRVQAGKIRERWHQNNRIVSNCNPRIERQRGDQNLGEGHGQSLEHVQNNLTACPAAEPQNNLRIRLDARQNLIQHLRRRTIHRCKLVGALQHRAVGIQRDIDDPRRDAALGQLIHKIAGLFALGCKGRKNKDLRHVPNPLQRLQSCQ